MNHNNALNPTPSTHPLMQRPFYHSLRQDLAEVRERLTGGLCRANAPVPDLVDWTAGVPPIRNQGQLGLCYGFADRTARMLAHWLAAGVPEAVDLSPGFAAWNARSIEGSVSDVNAGSTIGDSLAGMEQAGICAEELYPYNAADPTAEIAPPSAAAIADGLTRKVRLQAVPVDTSSFANVHQVLADRRPVIIGFSVTPSFEDCPFTGQLPLDPSSEPSLGGHAGVFCASHLSAQTLREVNSWGTMWGLDGTCYMTAKWLGQLFEAWTFVPSL